MNESAKSVIGTLALGMFAWGIAKALVVGAGRNHSLGCPLCEQKEQLSPRHLVKSLVTGPIMEEIQFREQLPKVMGENNSSLLFGALHASKKLSAAGNVARVVEAGLAGALVYSRAHKSGGLIGSSAVHAAHNLGAGVGLLMASKRRERAEGWHKTRAPGSSLEVCRCLKPGVAPCSGVPGKAERHSLLG